MRKYEHFPENKINARTDVSTLIMILNCTVVKYLNFLTRIVPNVLL